MFVTPDLYSSTATFIDLDDVEFFRAAIETAKSRMIDVADVDKTHSPVCYISRLSAQKESEMIAVPRKALYDKKRARRKFIMIDADFDTGQEDESNTLREKLISLADRYKTPLLMYPTKSYPEKPRFRAVLFTKSLMNEMRYEQAVRWLYQEVDIELLDASDTRITANRNLPIFESEEQIQNIYSTLDEDGLKPLDNSLWKDIEVKKRHKAQNVGDSDVFKDIRFDTLELIKAAKEIAPKKISQSYESFWKIAQSIALAVVDEQISEELALNLMSVLAEYSGNDKSAQWATENVQLLRKYISSLSESIEERAQARPLGSYSEFGKAIRIK